MYDKLLPIRNSIVKQMTDEAKSIYEQEFSSFFNSITISGVDKTV